MNCFGLSDIILQCDPEPSLTKWADSVNSKRQERTVTRSSPRRDTVAGKGAHDRTQYRPTTDSALMKWFVRHAAWLISRFKSNDAQSPFYHAMGGPYCGHVLESCECVLAHLPGVGKGSGNPAPKLADKWTSAWLGKSDLTDEHLVGTDEGVVLARSVRRIAEHSWSEENLRAVVATPQKPKSTTLDISPAADPLAPPPCSSRST